ncbi:hypothetical protein [Streptomyces longwoodensis]|uniref:hypothetical protein n=1 Tax=Streptomyces longwoodensis TaxID=68231 RepID=UPI00324DD3FD
MWAVSFAWTVGGGQGAVDGSVRVPSGGVSAAGRWVGAVRAPVDDDTDGARAERRRR